MNKWWNQKTAEQKKWFLIRTISSLVFLLFGLVFGIIVLKSYGWNFIDFIKNPTVDLIILILLALIIFCLSSKSGRSK